MGITRSLALGVLVTLSCLGSHAATVTLQAGAFKTEEDASSLASKIEGKGFSPVQVRTEENEKGVFYKVLVGEFDNRASAATVRNELKTAGFDSYIRAGDSYDKAVVSSALKGESYRPYFRESATSATDVLTSLSAELIAEKNSILENNTTAPETVARFTQFVQGLSPSAAKSHEIIWVGHYSYAGKSAYDNKVYNLSATRQLLQQVANGELPTTIEDCLTARGMLAHELQYYTRNYLEALDAYRQLLLNYEALGNQLKASEMRMAIAATAFELTTVAGGSQQDLENAVSDLWAKAIAEQARIIENDDTNAKKIRIQTSRIGLMLDEIIVQQKDWPRALELNRSIISSYEEFPECQGEIAEAYCHKAHIEIETKNPALAKASADKAIEIMTRLGKRQWGSMERDPLWKAYAWKNVAIHKLHAPKPEREELEREMRDRFPGHPGLDFYFGEKENSGE